jgi:predicted esterase YcpF (UPF0227 family)
MIASISKDKIALKTEKKIISLLKKEELSKLLDRYNLKILKDQIPDEKVTHFRNVLNNIKFNTEITNNKWSLKYDYKGSTGTTKIIFQNDFVSKKPTFIFHHGIAESVHPIHLKALANKDFHNRFNIITIRASNHNSGKDVFFKFLANFNNLTSSIATSVKATEAALQFHNNLTNNKSVICGVSLGGVVASLHYFHFGSANFYFPTLAYPNFREILLHPSNKNLIKNYELLCKNKSIKKCFKLSYKDKRKRRNIIYPILGEYDNIIDYTQTSKFWRGYKISTFSTGHHSIFLKRKQIRELIYNKVFS